VKFIKSQFQQAREQLGIDAVIGVSCYNAIDLAQSAQNQDANYVAFGALFPSVTKPDAPQCHLNATKPARQTTTLLQDNTL
jgi:thiamine-phosphate pyrophosphorylase